jgi:DnaA-homolog protein
MDQLPLEISLKAEPAFDNFVAGPNQEALARVRELAEGRAREAILYLWGEPGSGRSHLLRAARTANAALARGADEALVISDDVESLDPESQQALFIAINEARDGGPAVLAAGGEPPAKLALRHDLRTRLAWGLVYQLRPLSDADKARHLRDEAQRRGLHLSEEVAAYLLSRFPRDMASLNSVLDALDRYSLARQRPVTIPLIREALSDVVGSEQLPRPRG